MKIDAKVIVPNRQWVLIQQGRKVGTLHRDKRRYLLSQAGKQTVIGDINAVKSQFGAELFAAPTVSNTASTNSTGPTIYNYPCSSSPYNPVYDIKKKLPIFSKSKKSKSLYCAGHYLIQFRRGWVKSYCPKLITLERYPYRGPFASEDEVKSLAQVYRNETTEHNTN